jgi:ABC-type oligopeptide transport system ATPase subunit
VKVVTLFGKKGSGKTTLANKICSIYGYGRINFADKAKRIVMDMLDLPEHNIFGSDDDKNKLSEYVWGQMPGIDESNNNRMTYREILQYWLNEVFRKIDENWHIKHVEKYISCPSNNISYIIADGRFKNELNWAKKNNYLSVRLLRNNVSSDKHQSESELDIIPLDSYNYVLDNREQTVEQSIKELTGFINGRN